MYGTCQGLHHRPFYVRFHYRKFVNPVSPYTFPVAIDFIHKDVVNYKRTVMSEIMFEMLNIQSRHDYMDTLTEQLDCGKIKVKDLNKVVFMAANMGDKVALDILEEKMQGR